ncbi:MAG: DUF2779 domain-containing protein [Acholeplasmataceae bacterium]|nr:DUF2779 domain-containing protein [Acholeplasmataceae bacterium]
MRLSKTRFINYIRCNRYAALDELHREKNKAVVSFSDDPELADLISEENNEKKAVLLGDMYDQHDEDRLIQEDEQMKTMMPYYNRIEVLAGKAIQKRFEGQVVYSLDTFHQKRFEFEEDGFRFYCFLDGYQEDEKNIRIIEVKATTSKKFIDLDYKDDEQVKKPVFEFSSDGILMLREELGEIVNEHYHMKVQKLKNRLGDEGRYIYDIAYQRFVFEHAIKTKKNVKFYLAVLNSAYVHDGKNDAKGHPIYGDDLMVFMDVTQLTKTLLPTLEEDKKIVLKRLDTLNASPVPLGSHCQKKDARECVFSPICFQHIPMKNSIFVYMGGHNGFKDEKGIKRERFDLLNEGYVSADDIPFSWLERANNIIQRQVIDSQKPYHHKGKIKQGIKSLKYPIYHLDFETFPCPLPRFRGERPYAQSLFQFSIHVEKNPGICDKDLDNHYYIATEHRDLRKELIHEMLKVIKEDGGSVMVYNQSFEQTRLKEMAEIFPEYRQRLEDIINRLFDLMHLLKSNTKLYKALGYEEEEAKIINYYHTDLNGSYSIKKVLPVFSELTYQGMSIANGTEALVAYARFPEMDPRRLENTYKDLLEYCKQDTWAMVVILDKLRLIT